MGFVLFFGASVIYYMLWRKDLREKQHLAAYIGYMMLREESYKANTDRFLSWLEPQEDTSGSALYLGAINAIQSMAYDWGTQDKGLAHLGFAGSLVVWHDPSKANTPISELMKPSNGA